MKSNFSVSPNSAFKPYKLKKEARPQPQQVKKTSVEAEVAQFLAEMENKAQKAPTAQTKAVEKTFANTSELNPEVAQFLANIARHN